MSDEKTEQPEEAQPTTWKRRVGTWVRDVVIFAVLLSGVFWFQTRSLVDTGAEAPAWDLPTLDGQSLSSEELRGKPTLLFFWAPWCGVCEADAHNISAVREAVGDDANVVSVALSFESVKSVTDFVDRNGINAPTVLGDRQLADAYSINSFPTLYVLDSEGRVASQAVGYTTELGIRARLFLAD